MVETDGILYIDVFNSTLLKFSKEELAALDHKTRKARQLSENNTFSAYHENLRTCIEGRGGKVWATIGDCTIACGFANIDDAVQTAIAIQSRMSHFNFYDNEIGAPIIVRIGVSRGNLPDIPKKRRGQHSQRELDDAGHLQGRCPPGRVRISQQVFEACNFGKNHFRPALAAGSHPRSPEFVSIERMLTPQDQQGMAYLTPSQKRCYPLITASKKDYARIPYTGNFSKVQEVVKEAFVVIGETRKHPEVAGVAGLGHPASTSDAVGLIEVFAALQASPEVSAGIDEWVDSVDMASLMNLVLVGSPAVNIFAHAVNSVLSAGFVQDVHGPMRIRLNGEQHTLHFPKDFEHSEFDRHYALVYLTRSPINPKFDLLWIAGISGMATQAAARFVRDLVLNSRATLNRWNAHDSNVAVIAPRWKEGFTGNDYNGIWRITDYEAVWVGRR